MAEDKTATTVGTYRVVPITFPKPCLYNARGTVKAEDVSELAASIKENGVIEPIILRPDGEIIAGERRFVAAEVVGLTHIPAIIRKVSDDEAAMIALIENIQREQLRPISEARAYERLIEGGLTVIQITEATGIDRNKIYNALRLLKLPEFICNAIEFDKISVRAGIVFARAENIQARDEIAKRAIEGNWTEKKIELSYKMLDSMSRKEGSHANGDGNLPSGVGKSCARCGERIMTITALQNYMDALETVIRRELGAVYLPTKPPTLS